MTRLVGGLSNQQDTTTTTLTIRRTIHFPCELVGVYIQNTDSPCEGIGFIEHVSGGAHWDRCVLFQEVLEVGDYGFWNGNIDVSPPNAIVLYLEDCVAADTVRWAISWVTQL